MCDRSRRSGCAGAESASETSVPVAKQMFDDQLDDGQRELHARFDDETVGHETMTGSVGCQASFVTPSALEPRTRLLDESVALVELVEGERMPIEWQHPKQQEPTPEDDLARHDRCGQRSMSCGAGHVDERVEFEVHALHRGDGSPDIGGIGVERRGELECNHRPHRGLGSNVRFTGAQAESCLWAWVAARSRTAATIGRSSGSMRSIKNFRTSRT